MAQEHPFLVSEISFLKVKLHCPLLKQCRLEPTSSCAFGGWKGVTYRFYVTESQSFLVKWWKLRSLTETEKQSLELAFSVECRGINILTLRHNLTR